MKFRSILKNNIFYRVMFYDLFLFGIMFLLFVYKSLMILKMIIFLVIDFLCKNECLVLCQNAISIFICKYKINQMDMAIISESVPTFIDDY